MTLRRLGRVSLCAIALLTTACFHQVVNTGRSPGATVIEEAWVSTWLWGLVAAKPIDVRQQCPGGVAVVETQQSFVNGLVGAVTLGIYTPQRVRITCASNTSSLPTGATELRVALDASPEQRGKALEQAVERTLETGTATVLRY